MTMVFVTHDQEEALILSERMAILDQGKLIQSGSPMQIYQHPANQFVTDFLGIQDLLWQTDGTLLKVIKR